MSTALAWRLRQGEITAVLPGVYVAAGMAEVREALLAAAMVWDPDAVIVGRTAAALQFWPELAAQSIDLALPMRRRAAPTRFRIVHRVIPGQWVNRATGFRCTHPALTAVDLCPELGGAVIEQVLRSRQVTLGHLESALVDTPGRAGNRQRRRWLVHSVGRPWSSAEREAQQLLRDGGIDGWVGNRPLRVRGHLYYPDILFRRQRLVVEIDGFQHARDPEVFQSDRIRQNAFTLDGYATLRYTTHDVRHDRERLLHEVRTMLRALS